MNNEIAVALFITNYISMEKCDRGSGRGKATAGWQQSRVNTVADELRGCHQQSCDQSHVAACLSACMCASLRGSFSAVAFVGSAPVFAPTSVCRPVELQKDKWKKMEVTVVKQSVKTPLPGMLHLFCSSEAA